MRFQNSISNIVLGLLLTFMAGSPGNVLDAQEKRTLLDKALYLISAPSRELDPEAVYQQAPSWNVALAGDVRQFTVSQKNEFTIVISNLDDYGNYTEDLWPAALTTTLTGDISKSVGIQLGYGNLSLGWTQNIGKSTDLKKRSFFFDYIGVGYAAQLQYYDYQQYMDYQLVLGEEGSDDYVVLDSKTDKPGRLRSLIADGYYSFNQRTFAYSAAYKGDKVQRRSAGSFMAGVKLIEGIMEVEPGDGIVGWIGGIGRQTTTQIAVGGGYSYNLVPYHRQPDPRTGKGLRNITMNLTAIPMVTMFNQFSSTVYVYQDDADYIEKKSYMNGNLMVNYVAKAGLIYSWDKFSVSASGSYDSYSYKGKTRILLLGLRDNLIKSSGSFGRWSASLRFSMRF